MLAAAGRIEVPPNVWCEEHSDRLRCSSYASFRKTYLRRPGRLKLLTEKNYGATKLSQGRCSSYAEACFMVVESI